jgi:hypothetical protein
MFAESVLKCGEFDEAGDPFKYPLRHVQDPCQKNIHKVPASKLPASKLTA